MLVKDSNDLNPGLLFGGKPNESQYSLLSSKFIIFI